MTLEAYGPSSTLRNAKTPTTPNGLPKPIELLRVRSRRDELQCKRPALLTSRLLTPLRAKAASAKRVNLSRESFKLAGAVRQTAKEKCILLFALVRLQSEF
jgi:hypothetical protein